MLLNRKNSTKIGPDYKPKIVDQNRRKKINPDAICTIEVPFSTDLETGISRSVYSIDCMSMLAGSDTFNQFAKVFDEFKIQNYHLCIDMSKPASINTTAQNIFTLPWNLAEATFKKNDVVETINSETEFKQKIKDVLTAVGLCNEAGTIVGLDGDTDNNMVPLILYAYAYGNYGVVFNNKTLQLENNIELETIIDNTTPQKIKLKVEDFAINNVNVIITTYQIVGSCGLRQIPKNYYNFAFGNGINSEQRPDIYSNGFVESVGNYIWQSYMPGAPLHLSMDMKGTSATEKSLYYPTSVVYNLSALDSFNQSGRFSPVTLLQNKLGVIGGREMYTNGNGYVGSYDAVYLDTYRNNAYVQHQSVCGKFIFTVTVGNDIYEITFKIGQFPISYDEIGRRYMYDSGRLFNAVLSTNAAGERITTIAQTQKFNGFVLKGNNGINLSQMAYYLYDDETSRVESYGGAFSIQAFVTCKFRGVRNVLYHNQVVYPYLISEVKGGFQLNGRNFVFEDNYILPLNVNGYDDRTKTFMPIMRSEDGNGYIFACGYRTNNMNDKIFEGALLLPNGTEIARADYVTCAIGGLIIKEKTVGMKMDYCVFNQFNGYGEAGITLTTVIGNNTQRYYDVVAYIFLVLNADGTIDANYEVSPGNIPLIPVGTNMDYTNGQVTINGAAVNVTNLRDFSSFNLKLNLSRIRSMGVTDGGKNSIVEHSTNYAALSKGISSKNYANASVSRNGVYYCISFGGIVGNKVPNVTNLI